MNSKTRSLLAALALTASGTAVSAQTSWQTVGAGDWSISANWNNGIPTSGTDTFITNGTIGTPSVVTATSLNAQTLGLTLGANDQLNLNGSFLTPSGSMITNGGLITLNSSQLHIAASGTTTLNGGGTINLATGSNYILQAGGTTLDNVNNLIEGEGQIGYNGLIIQNEGIINGNLNGNVLVFLNSGGITNTGLLTSTNGGELQLAGSTVQNGGGTISSNGGTIALQNSVDVVGGTLTNTSGTLGVASGQIATLDGSTAAGQITLDGVFSVGASSEAVLAGAIDNTDQILVQSSGQLRLGADTSLTGGGTVTLGSNSYILLNAGTTLTNLDNSIEGQGQIGYDGLVLDNESVVNANSSGNTLLFSNGGGVTNTDLMEATNGGILAINGQTVTNAGGVIEANSGTVALTANATIDGGTLTNLGGTLGTGAGASATLNGVTVNGTYLADTSSTTYLENGLTINDELDLAANAQLHLLNNMSISGGTLIMGANTYILQNGASVFTNDAIIRGQGEIGYNSLALVNNDLIDANVNGAVLLITGTGNTTNNATMEATSGGILRFTGSAVANAGATLMADGGMLELQNGVVVTGGQLINTGASGSWLGTVASNSATLTGVTISGLYTADNSSTTYLNGTISNGSEFDLNSSAQLHLVTDTTLTGGGTLVMGANTYILQNGAATFTNVNNLIEGQGTIGYNSLELMNESTIDANVANAVLSISGTASTVNTGTMEATNGGELVFSGSSVNNAGGQITANGGTVTLQSNVLVTGGTLAQAGTGVLGTGVNSSSTLGNVTLAGTFTVGADATQYLQDTITNLGTILVGSSAQIHTLDAVTLNGGGTLTLQGPGNYILQAVGSGPATLENVDNLVDGTGTIGYNGLSLINDAQGTVRADNGLLQLTGSGSMTNWGTYEVKAGNTLSVTAALSNFSGSTLTGGTYIVNGATGSTGLMAFNLDNNLGGEIVNNAATIVLNGPSAATLLNDQNGNNALSNLAANSAASSALTVEGGYQLATPGDFSNAGTVTIGSGSLLRLGQGIVLHAYTQSGGYTNIRSGGELTAASVHVMGGTIQVDGTLDPMAPTVIDFGATLDGTGSILGDLTNNGDLVLGDSPSHPGLLSELGDFIQSPTGTMGESIENGVLNGEFEVAGDVTVGGDLNLDILNGFHPAHDETFNLLYYSGNLALENGGFTITGVGDPADWSVSYLVTPTQIPLDQLNANDVLDHEIVLEFTGGQVTSGVPEPSDWADVALLAALALAAPFIRRRQVSTRPIVL